LSSQFSFGLMPNDQDKYSALMSWRLKVKWFLVIALSIFVLTGCTGNQSDAPAPDHLNCRSNNNDVITCD
ncbi:hypothetical protein, partial [Serratia marcescens]|uniref:hypothetical protein n=1 Tax=Serratia marcescens TaxID=615 RepID=UPI001BAF2857